MVVVVIAALSARDLCHGASGADGRAACCKRATNTCTRVSSDDCCAQGEQRNTRVVPTVTPGPARDMTAGPLVIAFDPPFDPVAADDLADARPRVHLLHSVFLI